MVTGPRSPTPVPELLRRVRAAGVELQCLPPDRVLYSGFLPEDLVSELQARAPEIVAHVLRGEGPGARDPERTRPASARTQPATERAHPGRRDLRAELDRLGDSEPEARRLDKVGDTLIGVILEYRCASTPYGECVVVHLAEEGTGELAALWLLHETLISRFRELRPRVGERVAVRRLTDDPHGRYRRYRVLVDRPAGPGPELDELLPPAPEPRSPEASPPPDPPDLADPDDDLPF